VETFAVGFARPDRWSQPGTDASCPWHAVAAHRPAEELDGEVELALCGAIVQVWGSQKWSRVGIGRTACAGCRRLASVPESPAVTPSGNVAAENMDTGNMDAGNVAAGNVPAPASGGRRLRVVS
jgi:hypothetical protein